MNGQAPAPVSGPSQPEQQTAPWKLITLFVFAVCAFGVLILIARFDRDPSPTTWYIYLTVLALAAGGMAALLPGAINVEVHGGLKAGGALAVFALVFYLGISKAPAPKPGIGLSLVLVFADSNVPPPNPIDSDVYVFVDSKVATADVLPLHKPLYVVDVEWENTPIQVIRGQNGFTVNLTKLAPNNKVAAVVHSATGEWHSADYQVPSAVPLPEGKIAMLSSTSTLTSER